MKTIATALLTLLVSLQMMAGKVIKIQDIEYAPSWMTIKEVELTKDATIISGTLEPGASILNNTVLVDRNTGKEYKFLRVEGIKAYELAKEETPCTVYFEPLDASVKEINYIEVGNNPLLNYYGIKLQQKTKAGKKSKAFDPESLNYDYYMNKPFTPDTAWHFSNEPYKKALEAGKAQLKIHVSGVPKELLSVLPNTTARVQNQITRQEENSVVSIGEDNCYVLDLNLPYPQFVYTQPLGSVFIAPGDTLEMFSTYESAPDDKEEPRFKTFRGNSESAMINTLLPEFMKKYGRKEYEYAEAQATIGKGKDATQEVLEHWANQVNEIIADEELRQALIHSPLSTFGKDLVMASILTNKCIEIEDVVSDYKRKANTYTKMEDGNWKIEPNHDYVELDLKAVYNIMLKNKELIYNNPLALCERSQWVFVNRTLFGPLLFAWELYTDDDGVERQRRCDKYGMAGTFMNDLFLSQDIVSKMENVQKGIKLGKLGENQNATLDYMSKNVGESLAGIQNVKVAQNIVEEYRKFVKATETAAEDTGNKWTEEQTALWNRIVSPYKGNTLFLDFWGMSCGPCRSGMMSQKKLVEEMKDMKVKFLYITTADQKSSAEKWMTENNIKGEHVYITRNEWKQFETMINFTAIPRGALVSKEGKLIEQDFEIHQFNSEELKKLAERF